MSESLSSHIAPCEVVTEVVEDSGSLVRLKSHEFNKPAKPRHSEEISVVLWSILSQPSHNIRTKISLAPSGSGEW